VPYFYYEYKKKQACIENKLINENNKKEDLIENENLKKKLYFNIINSCNEGKIGDYSSINDINFLEKNSFTVEIYNLFPLLNIRKYFTLRQKIDFIAQDYFLKIKEKIKELKNKETFRINLSGFCSGGNIAIKLAELFVEDPETKTKISDISLFTFGTMFSKYDLNSLSNVLKENISNKIYSYAVKFDRMVFANPFSTGIKNIKDFLCNIFISQLYDLPFLFKNNESFKAKGQINNFVIDKKFDHNLLYSALKNIMKDFNNLIKHGLVEFCYDCDYISTYKKNNLKSNKGCRVCKNAVSYCSFCDYIKKKKFICENCIPLKIYKID
jgi:hypothetical protein